MLAERDAIHHLRPDVPFLETFQPDCGSHFNWTTETHTAALGIYKDHRARFGKRMIFIEARESYRKLARDSGTTSGQCQFSELAGGLTSLGTTKPINPLLPGRRERIALAEIAWLLRDSICSILGCRIF